MEKLDQFWASLTSIQRITIHAIIYVKQNNYRSDTELRKNEIKNLLYSMDDLANGNPFTGIEDVVNILKEYINSLSETPTAEKVMKHFLND